MQKHTLWNDLSETLAVVAREKVAVIIWSNDRRDVSDTPIVKNFENKAYLDATIGTKSLPQAYAELDQEVVREKMKPFNVNDEIIHEKIWKCLEIEFFTKRMSRVDKNLKSN